LLRSVSKEPRARVSFDHEQDKAMVEKTKWFACLFSTVTYIAFLS